ncbi:MAG: hypothetical protein AB7T63_10470 [Planctomycetota bacterium]
MAFTRDGSAFLASKLFADTINVWPTAHVPKEVRAPPAPTHTLSALATMAFAADVGPDGTMAFALADGNVVLQRLAGKAPVVESPPGEGASRVAFTARGRHVLAIRAGRLWRWDLPRPPAPPEADRAKPAPK